MSRPGSGSMQLIQQLKTSQINYKVRTYGRVLAVDVTSSHIILEHQGHAVLVDLSLCLGGARFLPGVKDTVGVIAYVEERGTQAAPSIALPFEPSFQLHREVTLSAIMLLDANNLDLNKWTQAVQATAVLSPLPFQTRPSPA